MKVSISYNKNLIKLGMVLVLVLSIFYWGLGAFAYYEIYTSGSIFTVLPELCRGDAEWIWQTNAYLCNGILPSKLVENTYTVIPHIGIVPDSLLFGTPWTFWIANIFLPGFLPFEYSIFIGIFWVILLWGFASKLLYEQFSKYEKTFALLLTSSIFCYSAVSASIAFMNPAVWITPLLLISILLSHNNKHPYWSGIFLGIAMLKPHTAALFFIPFFIEKKYKSIFVASLFVIIPWAAESILIGENPVSLFISYFGKAVGDFASTGGTNQFPEIMGLFGPLLHNNFPEISTLVHLTIFIPLTFYLCFIVRKAPFYILYSIPTVFSMFWLYCQPTGRAVCLLAIALLILLYERKHSLWFNILGILCLIVIFSPIYSSAVALYLNATWIIEVANVAYIIGLSMVLICYHRKTTKSNLLNS